MPRNHSERGPYVVAKRTIIHTGLSRNLRIWLWLVTNTLTHEWFHFYQSSTVWRDRVSCRRYVNEQQARELFRERHTFRFWDDLLGERVGHFGGEEPLPVPDFLNFDGESPKQDVLP